MSDQCRCHAFSRRRIVAAAGLAPVFASGLVRASLAADAKAAPAKAPVAPQEAKKRLVDGNARYAHGDHLRLDHSARRESQTRSQSPFAIVLGCADSRVPPEVVFDQGLGDIFTVRVAGNIVDDVIAGSIEYAVAVLGAQLIVVLGHERCGAVAAALDAVKTGKLPDPHIASLVAAIKPAAESVRSAAGDPLDNAIRANVNAVVAQLKGSAPLLKPAVDAGKLQVIGAEYMLASGLVTFLS